MDLSSRDHFQSIRCRLALLNGGLTRGWPVRASDDILAFAFAFERRVLVESRPGKLCSVIAIENGSFQPSAAHKQTVRSRPRSSHRPGADAAADRRDHLASVQRAS